MKEQDMIYLAGLVDGIGSLEVNVSPHESYATGFRFEPKFRMGLHESDTAVLGMLDEYCEQQSVKYSIEERSDSLRFVVQDPDHICRFIAPFGDYLIRKFEQARLMLHEILPAVKDGVHQSKQGLYEMMAVVEALRESHGRGRDPKYTQEWFEEEWGDELEI